MKEEKKMKMPKYKIGDKIYISDKEISEDGLRGKYFLGVIVSSVADAKNKHWFYGIIKQPS